MRLLDILQPSHILVPLHAVTLRAAVMALIQRLVETGAIAHPDRLERAFTEERIRDVVHVGEHVLLPHLRTDAVNQLVVAIGIAREPLQVQDDDESSRARVAVLVLAPPEAASQYLRVVAALARTLRTDATAAALATARSPEDVLAIPGLRDLTVQPTLTVRDVMTTQVFRVYPDTPVGEVLDLMRRHQQAAIPVVGEKREVLGVVSEGDILRHLLPLIGRVSDADLVPSEESEKLFETSVREVMTRSVMCISEDQPLTDVVSTMINKNVDRLPVVHEGKLTGFLTRADVMRKLLRS